MRKLNSRRYYTTPLAVSLLSGAAHADGGAQRGFLIVETNFRLYAYTDSGLWAGRSNAPSSLAGQSSRRQPCHLAPLGSRWLSPLRRSHTAGWPPSIGV